MKTTISFAIFAIRLIRTKVNTFRASSYITLMCSPVERGATQHNWEKVIKGMVENFDVKMSLICSILKSSRLFFIKFKHCFFKFKEFSRKKPFSRSFQGPGWQFSRSIPGQCANHAIMPILNESYEIIICYTAVTNDEVMWFSQLWVQWVYCN